MIFLIGAGTSIPAGLDDIESLTKNVESEITAYSRLDGEAYYYVKQRLISEYAKVDIEDILKTLDEFDVGTRETTHVFYEKKDQEFSRHQPLFKSLKRMIKSIIRKYLEKKFKVEYLIGLKGFVEEQEEHSSTAQRLDIFTTNYDSVIETFCEQQGIEYTDGFEVSWNPNLFKGKKGINLYKLHGSLYWFKTSRGKIVKIPLKKLPVDNNIFYYTGEEVEETMIYPAAFKEIEATPYSYLREEFKSKLINDNLLIVVGYSFRDNEILSLVQEQLLSNSSLWLTIVDPKPYKIKEKICKGRSELSDRIVSLQMRAEEAFSKRILNHRIRALNRAILAEKQYESYRVQYSSYGTTEYHLLNAIKDYKVLNHKSRIKTLVEEIFSIFFIDSSSPTYEFLSELFEYSLSFCIDSIIESSWNKAELWFQIFGSVAIHNEWNLTSEIDPQAGVEYNNRWNSEQKEDIPFRYTVYGINTRHLKLLEEILKYDLREDRLDEKEPKIKQMIITILELLRRMCEIRKYREANESTWKNIGRKYIHRIQEKKGLIDYLPVLSKLISKKVIKSKSLVINWSPGILLK